MPINIAEMAVYFGGETYYRCPFCKTCFGYSHMKMYGLRTTNNCPFCKKEIQLEEPPIVEKEY